jgi:hypothetical protein
MAKDDKQQNVEKTLDQPPKAGDAPQVNPAPAPAPVAPVHIPAPVAPAPQPQVVVLRDEPRQPPNPIPGFSETVPGGRYVNARGQVVDAHGIPIPEGRKQQVRGVREKQLAEIDDISKIPMSDEDDDRAVFDRPDR